MNAHSAFLEPLDVWSFRGNKLFGDAGSWGAALMPPPPSVVAGAVRSALLSRDRVDLGAFARGEVNHWQLGTPQAPGAFVLADLHPARKQAGCVEPLFPLPADLVPSDGAAPSALRPVRVHASLRSSAPLPMLPVLAQTVRSKPGKGRWLTAGGMQRWLAGQAIEAAQVEEDSELWLTEERVGVALEAERRRAEDGKLFSLQAVACRPGVGLGLRVYGADLTPCVVRLGGDGRGARLEPIAIDWPEPDFEALARAGRMRLVLTSPGIFTHGWLPNGVREASAQDIREHGAPFELHGVRGRIVCAAVPRGEVISGWDLARWQPKPAQRAVPAGAVYWLELGEAASADALRKLVEFGLWSEGCEDPQRRAEGFNRCLVGAWND